MSKHRSGNKNKRSGSSCSRKMMSAKQKSRKTRIYLFGVRQQSNLKALKIERRKNKTG